MSGNVTIADLPAAGALGGTEVMAMVQGSTTAKAALSVLAAFFAITAVAQATPAGSIGSFAQNTVPTGWLKANGATLLRSSYADLFAALVKSSTVTMTVASPAVVTWTAHPLKGNDPVKFTTTGALPTGLVAGTTYYVVGSSILANSFEVSAAPGGTAINTSGPQSGVHTAISAPFGDGDGSTTFTIPDLRGYFLRGQDDSGLVDPNRSFGTTQTDALLAHTHYVASLGQLNSTSSGCGSFNIQAGQDATCGSITSASTGGTETRPKNVALLLCIKY